ncbi:Scr1 family TA system antitoxin-like transcriptional regulator [Streptomyces katrae]|uniref:Scr1 family TA system antitoxin-like transcriptional regulator n=1 Tax=Streptomyces katrae TaxID=68223 RepID=A0ABT7GX50_9ACTN|nr:Scr1 family TA system antitoxin-like transcriptional regulator [Streptomyces katrae]MDK9497479.1 Scr1 family TA system antitoxin-like transcriptional regulator [Streptomyces katrae]
MEGQAYVPDMIWGTLQTEAYATVILTQVVNFLGVPDDVPAGVAERMQRQQVLHDGLHHYALAKAHAYWASTPPEE